MGSESVTASVNRSLPRQCYRPTPLRWPFIMTQIFLLTHTLVLVVYLRHLGRGSESTAHFEDRRSVVPFLQLHRRDIDGSGSSTEIETTAALNGNGKEGEEEDEEEAQHRATPYPTPPITITITVPLTVEVSTTTTIVSEYTTTFYDDTGYTPEPWPPPDMRYPGPSPTPTYMTTLVTTLGTSTLRTAPSTSTRVSIPPQSQESLPGHRVTYGTTIIGTRTRSIVEVRTVGVYMSVRTDGASATPLRVTVTGVIPASETVVTVTPAPVTHMAAGNRGGGGFDEVVVTTPPVQVITSMAAARTSIVTLETVLAAGDAGHSVISLTLFSTMGGTLVTRTRQRPAAEVVSTGLDGRPTTSMSTPPPETYVILEDATTIAVATIPIAVTQVPGARLTTIVSTPSPRSVVTVISGTPTTMVTTPSPTSFVSTILPDNAPSISWAPKTITQISDQGTGFPGSEGSGNGTVVIDAATFNLTPTTYFLGSFLPTMIAMLLSVPIALIDLNAKLFQPFHALASASATFAHQSEGRGEIRGVSASRSLTLTFTGTRNALLGPLTLLFQNKNYSEHGSRQPVPFLTTLLNHCAWIMVPLASEAVSLQIHGTCSNIDVGGCAVALGIAAGPTNALVVLLGIMVLLLALVLHLVRGLEYEHEGGGNGVFANPTSVVGVASLMATRDGMHVRSLVRALDLNPPGDGEGGEMNRKRGRERKKGRRESQSGQGFERALEQQLEGKRFGLGWDDQGRYGLVMVGRDEGRSLLGGEVSPVVQSGSWGNGNEGRKRGTPFVCLALPWRAFMLCLHLAIIAVVAYYLIRDTSPELLVFASGFGFRFLFSGVGQVVSLLWDDFFITVATINPFLLMAKHPQPANTSILLGRPTNEFYCLYKAFKHRDLFLALVAAVTILGKALPVVMSNIAYTLSQTYISYLVCAGASIAILSVMTLTLAGSMFVRWPYLPVDPRTMAGTLYYFAADPDVAEGFAGLGHLQRAERNRRVEALGRRFSYGRIADQRGSGGRIKMGIIAG